MTVIETKKVAKESMIIRLTFDGAFQRAKIYDKKATDAERKEFRNTIADLLPKYLKRIQNRKRYLHNDHYKTIELFTEEVSKKHKNILNGNKFRIGNAQKFLNLYWKVSWLLQKGILQPIQCPFDSIIMKKLPLNVRVAWTAFDTIDEYKALVKAVQNKIGESKSIAEWELEIYLKAIKESQ